MKYPRGRPRPSGELAAEPANDFETFYKSV